MIGGSSLRKSFILDSEERVTALFLPPNVEIEGARLQRYDVGMNSDERISADGGIPNRIPFMPAGVHRITATVNGQPGLRRIVVNEQAAERLQADLEAALDESRAHRRARPAVYFDHRPGPAAAYPRSFSWEEGRGVMLELERWSDFGRAAVEGGAYGYVSPVFRADRSSGDVLGLVDGVEVASLVNDPAFERIDPIMDVLSASRAFGFPVFDCSGEDVINAACILPPRAQVASSASLRQNDEADHRGGFNHDNHMDIAEIKKLLGLPEDADDASVMAAVKKLTAHAKKVSEELKAAQEELKKKGEEVKCLREADAQRRVDGLVRKGLIAPKEADRIEAAKAMALADPEGFDKVFGSMTAQADMLIAGKVDSRSSDRSNADVLQAEMNQLM